MLKSAHIFVNFALALAFLGGVVCSFFAVFFHVNDFDVSLASIAYSASYADAPPMLMHTSLSVFEAAACGQSSHSSFSAVCNNIPQFEAAGLFYVVLTTLVLATQALVLVHLLSFAFARAVFKLEVFVYAVTPAYIVVAIAYFLISNVSNYNSRAKAPFQAEGGMGVLLLFLNSVLALIQLCYYLGLKYTGSLETASENLIQHQDTGMALHPGMLQEAVVTTEETERLVREVRKKEEAYWNLQTTHQQCKEELLKQAQTVERLRTERDQYFAQLKETQDLLRIQDTGDLHSALVTQRERLASLEHHNQVLETEVKQRQDEVGRLSDLHQEASAEVARLAARLNQLEYVDSASGSIQPSESVVPRHQLLQVQRELAEVKAELALKTRQA